MIIVVISEAALEQLEDVMLLPSDMVISVEDLAELRGRKAPALQVLARRPGDDGFWNELSGCGSLAGWV